MGYYLISSSNFQIGITTTILGFGTVFFVLIIISLILMLFGKLMKIFSKPEEKQQPEIKPIVKTEPEQSPETEEISVDDNSELIAVITAAIAASMGGNVGPDKLVVKSLRRVRSGRKF